MRNGLSVPAVAHELANDMVLLRHWAATPCFAPDTADLYTPQQSGCMCSVLKSAHRSIGACSEGTELFILVEGAIVLPVTLSGGVQFAS